MTTLRDVFPDWNTKGGIFVFFSNMPWGKIPTAQQLGIMYYGTHSGSKEPSFLTMQYAVNGVVLGQLGQILASVVREKFYTKWSKLYATMVQSYSPIENYQMEEYEDYTASDDNETNSSSTRTPNLVQNAERSSSAEQTDYKYGFNTTAADGEPSDKHVGEDSATIKTMPQARKQKHLLIVAMEVQNTP